MKISQFKVHKAVYRNLKQALKKIVSNYHQKHIEETKLWLNNQKCLYKRNKRKWRINYQSKQKVKAQIVLKLTLYKINKFLTMIKKQMKKCRHLDCSAAAKTSTKKKIMNKRIK